MCWLCHVAFGDKCDCFDLSASAAWRHRLVNMGDVNEDLRQSRYPSGIWSIPGISIQSFKPDWMYCCCLGILQYLQGNVMYELFKELDGDFQELFEPL